METGLKGKVVIVTGGASGIGRATVEKLAEEGAIPVFIDKDNEKGVLLSKQLNEKEVGDYMFLNGDLINDYFCKESIKETVRRYGKLEILINNAGKNDRCDLDDTSPEEFRKSLDRNLVHYYSMSHYAWPHLKRTRGVIVLVGSKVSLVGEGKTIAYATAKGAINAMTRELATKSCNENLGIRINCVLPGIVKTALYDEYMIEIYGNLEKGSREFAKRIPLDQRPTTPEEIANTIIFLASDLS